MGKPDSDRNRTLRGRWTAAFAAWIESTHPVLVRRVWPFSFYDHSAIERRLIQRVVDLTYERFLREISTNISREIEIADVAGKRAGVVLTADFWFRPTLSFWIREVRYFGLLWVFALIQIIKSRLPGIREWELGPAAIVADLGANVSSEGTDARLVRFVDYGPVEVMRSCRRFIFQTVREVRVQDPRRFKYSRWPAMTLLYFNPAPIGHVVRTISRHFGHAFRFLFLSVIRPEIVLLARDYALTAVYESLHSRNLIEATFLTDANYASQELYLGELPNRSSQVHFLWHSQNTRGVLVKGEEFQWEYPQRPFMKMDHNWFWTPKFEKWLVANGVQAEMHAVGPIMFEIPRESEPKENRDFEVTLFDVTPTHETWQKENGWPFMYYSREVSTRFLDDVVEAAGRVGREANRRVVVRLKHKRNYGPIHDRGYIEHVEALARAGRIVIEAPDVNIFDLVRRSDAVLAIPFTSAALVARSEGRPAAFYDPTGEVWVADDLHTCDVPLLSGPDALAAYLSEVV